MFFKISHFPPPNISEWWREDLCPCNWSLGLPDGQGVDTSLFVGDVSFHHENLSFGPPAFVVDRLEHISGSVGQYLLEGKIVEIVDFVGLDDADHDLGRSVRTPHVVDRLG